jgi:hypothetical protein
VQVQPPLEQLLKRQVAPASHVSEQFPLEHATVQVEPAAHAVTHLPLEQPIVHVAPAGQDVAHSPLEQSTLQAPSPQ